MKKEENQKMNHLMKPENDFRSRSQSPKAYLGCDTCKLKNSELKKVKSISRFSDFGHCQDRNKIKKPPLERDEKGMKKSKVKLTDLCDEDKKRIVELIEELSKLAEKNQELKEALDFAQKKTQEQQDYIMKQANLHLEEKNFYVNEINEYKTRIEAFQNETKGKMFQWENLERRKDAEIAYLAKALQKSLKEKNEMSEQMNHLKICLRHSLESFQRLRAEVTELQRQEQRLRKFKSIMCQTEANAVGTSKEKYHSSGDNTEEEEEEFLSTCNQDTVNAKSSIDIINDKLEYVYQLLKRKSESLAKSNPQKLDIDLSILLKNEKLTANENFQVPDDLLKEQSDEENLGKDHKFSRPLEECSKTSEQAERIFKKMEKPLNLAVSEGPKKSESNTLISLKTKETPEGLDGHSVMLKHKIVQKNKLFQSSEDHQYDEDRLLEELFYSDHSLNFGLDSILRLEVKETTFHNPPFA